MRREEQTSGRLRYEARCEDRVHGFVSQILSHAPHADAHRPSIVFLIYSRNTVDVRDKVISGIVTALPGLFAFLHAKNETAIKAVVDKLLKYSGESGARRCVLLSLEVSRVTTSVQHALIDAAHAIRVVLQEAQQSTFPPLCSYIDATENWGADTKCPKDRKDTLANDENTGACVWLRRLALECTRKCFSDAQDYSSSPLADDFRSLGHQERLPGSCGLVFEAVMLLLSPRKTFLGPNAKQQSSILKWETIRQLLYKPKVFGERIKAVYERSVPVVNLAALRDYVELKNWRCVRELSPSLPSLCAVLMIRSWVHAIVYLGIREVVSMGGAIPTLPHNKHAPGPLQVLFLHFRCAISGLRLHMVCAI